MSGTLQVLALITMSLMLGAFLLAYLERRLMATWTLVVAFGFATFWSALNILWAQNNETAISAQSWLLMTTMAAAAAVYYFYLGMDGYGLGGDGI